MKTTLRAEIKRLRGALSMAEAARRCGISRSYWQAIESGNRVPPDYVMLRVARIGIDGAMDAEGLAAVYAHASILSELAGHWPEPTPALLRLAWAARGLPAARLKQLERLAKRRVK